MSKNVTSEKVEDIKSVTVASSVLANLLSVTDRRIRDLAQEGIIVRVKKGRYDLAQSIKNYIVHLKANNDIKEVKNDNLDLDTERALHEIVKREKTELQVKVMKGELHYAEDVEKVMTDMLANFRSKILGLAPKLAPMLVSRSNLTEVQDIINNECLLALSELADYDPILFYNEKYIDFELEEDTSGDVVEKNKNKDS
ncbi:hypothetical protein CLPU_6c00290 [Gottschalkia purinilytica]|uniref:Phage DNA packaging protein, Nu1 subunit of terminase n=1 Tax=Gottschalkia purinilytica TaxID=1503 RepID=A0A0L0WAI9_GOTPU|nr:hypothetical protein [Gottschalkia purinilytica]KNF08543.1 hypothetical protein CLPU_6c00290 [Gottschalkia purinilytica]